MTTLARNITNQLSNAIARDKSVLLLGPRQTGKTTLIEQWDADLFINFANPKSRLRYETNPGILIDEAEALTAKERPLIIIDEVQKVPDIMDAAQYLIDKKTANFILTGSSARKLKRDHNINLLPGRVIPIHMDALTLNEIPQTPTFSTLNDLLMYGSLPEIVLTKESNLKEELLDAYVTTYLEEEVRAEAIVRNLAHFARFLELAAAEAGYCINMSKFSQTIGVASSTIESYYQILEDCLITERIEPITESKTRHRLSKAKKYLFYDLGVRRMAAREGVRPPLKYMGHVFEQFIGIECIRLARLQSQRTRMRYWKDQNGPEVDWVIEQDNQFIPIEVKWTEIPSIQDARHLQLFLQEYKNSKTAYIICQTPNPMKLADQVYALPWQRLADCFK